MFANAKLILRLSLLITSGSVWADDFQLSDGRRYSGKVLPRQNDDSLWTVEVAPQTFVRFDEAQIDRAGHKDTKWREKALSEYKEKLAQVQQTVESQIEIGSWCTANRLTEQATAHYFRALDFDPNNELARAKLNYKKDENGRWVDRDTHMTDRRGKVRDKSGRYLYPEVMMQEKAERELEEAKGKLRKEIRRWQADIENNRANRADSFAKFQQLADPIAIAILGEVLQDVRRPASPEVRQLCIEVLGRFHHFAAVAKLTEVSILDADGNIRDLCLDELKKFGSEFAISAYIGYLQNPKPELINRAAVCLEALEADEAVLPLIQAVVSKHQVTVKGSNNFSNSGSMTFGGDKPRNEIRESQNQQVLSALTTLTGQNFLYDKDAWIAWYAKVHASPVGDLRRDP